MNPQDTISKMDRGEIPWDDNVRAAANKALSGGRGFGGDFGSITRQALQLQQEANRPAIESIRASIPTTEASYAQREQRLAGEREPLKQRYQSLLDELKRREGVQTGEAQQRTKQEFGYRGIPLSSTLYSDELIRAARPISEFYTGQTRDVGLERETALRGITGQLADLPIAKQQELNLINQAMAQLQSGGASAGIQNALAMYQQQQAAKQTALQQALQEREFALKERIATQPKEQDRYVTLGEGSTLYDLLTGKSLYKSPKTYKPSSQSDDWE